MTTDLSDGRLVFAVSTAMAQRRHPPQGEPLQEWFCSTWYMPDNPAVSCCNKGDCYPTEIKFVDRNIYARRRENGKYILIPPQKVERDRDSRDMKFPIKGARTSHPQNFCPRSSQLVGNAIRDDLRGVPAKIAGATSTGATLSTLRSRGQ